ncbi:MAG: hypothetical protein QOH53_460 [Ilumatobacteraceae bacterium]
MKGTLSDRVATIASIAALATAVVKTTADKSPQGGSAQQHNDTEARSKATGTSKTGALGRIDLWQQRRPVVAVPVAVYKKFADDRAGRLAALIAYYGFFSLFPAMLAMVTVLGFVLQHHPAERVRIAHSALAQFPIIGDTLSNSVAHPLSGSTLALAIGLAGAVWAGLGAMQALQDAMNEVWDVKTVDYPKLVAKRLRSMAMLVLIAVLLVSSTALAQVAGAFVAGVAATALVVVAAVAFNVVAFLVAFRVLTVAQRSWRMVLPGACAASAGYTLLQLLGGLYVSTTLQGAQNTYGTFAVVIGLLSWIYLIAQLVMFAAELNVVTAKRMWPRSLFTEPATSSDRRSAAAQADKEVIAHSMHVDVAFDATNGR